MSSVICKILKDIEIGMLEKTLVHDGKVKQVIERNAKVIPIKTLKSGIKVQVKYGINEGTEQKVYIASKQYGSGWFQTKNGEGYSLNEIFVAVRTNRTPWEALY